MIIADDRLNETESLNTESKAKYNGKGYSYRIVNVQ